MNRSSKVRAVYHELRIALGDQVSAKEALRSAARMVELFDADDALFGASVREQRANFDELPVDVAVADGGWRVLSKERGIINAEFGGEEMDIRTRTRLRNYGLELAA